jgi:hypothetical protein
LGPWESNHPPRRLPGDMGGTPHAGAYSLSPPSGSWPPFLLVSDLLADGRGSSFSRSSPQSSPSRSRVCSLPMLGGGVRFCRWSVAPLRLGFPGGAGDAEATT